MGEIFTIIMNSGLVAKTVLLVLLILSIISWAIIIDKLKLFSKVNKETEKFQKFFEDRPAWGDLFSYSKGFNYSPFPRIIMRIYYEFRRWSKQTKETASGAEANPAMVKKKPLAFAPLIESAIAKETSILERRIVFLSTTVSVSPFLGLLGTVWGIMSAFLSMGTRGAADLATVGPGIAEALITTAAGLGVAIPVLLAYNYFVDKLRKLSDDLEIFSSDLLQLVERERN